MEFIEYRSIVFGSSSVLLILEICFLILLSNQFLVELIEKFFGIIRLDNQKLLINFFGININWLSSRRFRLSLIIQLALILWISLLLLLNGSILQIRNLSPQQLCPLTINYCFQMKKSLRYKRIVCSSGEILSNISSTNVVCFVLIYSEQDALSVLNQIGICSSVFSLLCHLFQGTCRLSRKWWGLSFLLFLLIISLTLLILSFIIIEMNISITAKLLLIAFISLLINVIQLVQFTYYYRLNHLQP